MRLACPLLGESLLPCLSVGARMADDGVPSARGTPTLQSVFESSCCVQFPLLVT